jgi:hypothetical protein
MVLHEKIEKKKKKITAQLNTSQIQFITLFFSEGAQRALLSLSPATGQTVQLR